MRSWLRPTTSTRRSIVLLIVAAFFTAFYMGRQVLMVFFGKPRSSRLPSMPRKARPLMTVPLIILAVLSVLGGLLNLPGHPHLWQLAGAHHQDRGSGKAYAGEAAQLPADSILWWRRSLRCSPSGDCSGLVLYNRRYQEILKLPRCQAPGRPAAHHPRPGLQAAGKQILGG